MPVSITHPPAYFAFRRIIAVGLIFLCFALLIPAPVFAQALETSLPTLNASRLQFSRWFYSFFMIPGVTAPGFNQDRSGVRPSGSQSKAEKELQVSAIELNVAGEVVVKSRQRISLSAIPVDSQGNTIHGLVPRWESSNKQVLFIKKSGEAIAGKPGSASLTARLGDKSTTVSVTVVNERFRGKKQTDSIRRSKQENFEEAAIDKSTRSDRKYFTGKRAHASRTLKTVSGVMPFVRDPNDDPLPDNETTSLYQTNNLTGVPPGKTKPGPMAEASVMSIKENGIRNFTFELPAVGLLGRGIDTSISLVYNSLVWNRSTSPSNNSTWMTYDVDSGYPGQGFRLGFGQIEDQGSAGYTLIENDGTRHALVLSTGTTYETNDGSFIRFVDNGGGGRLSYPDGTRVEYSASGGGYRYYPTLITDRNGNYITINYVNGVGPRIYSIQDTIGRLMRFYYDSNNDLVAITTPGLSGQPDLQVMRFYYESLTLPSGLFASGINVSKPATARVVRYIYLPASAEGSTSSSGDTGFRFDYSQYGMIYQIKKFRGMTASTNSTSATGTVTEGTSTIAATTTYGYPTTASVLSDVPTFGYRDDEWAGRTSGGGAPRHTFTLSEGSTEVTSTVTAPDGSVAVSKSIKNSGAWNDGLVKETRIENGSATVFAKTQISWEQNPTNGTPRVANVKLTNEANKTRSRVFTYDSTTPYNNVSVISERDFTSDGSLGSEMRRTETTYVTSSNYLDRQLLHLPSIVKLFPGGSSTPVARIDYAYDNYGTNYASLTARNDIIMHDVAFDPFQEWQEICDWECMQWGYPTPESPFQCIDWQWICNGYNPYDPATDYRGNVTSVTTYPDATTTTGAITHQTTYDITGNVITAQEETGLHPQCRQ